MLTQAFQILKKLFYIGILSLPLITNGQEIFSPPAEFKQDIKQLAQQIRHSVSGKRSPINGKISGQLINQLNHPTDTLLLPLQLASHQQATSWHTNTFPEHRKNHSITAQSFAQTLAEILSIYQPSYQNIAQLKSEMLDLPLQMTAVISNNLRQEATSDKDFKHLQKKLLTTTSIDFLTYQPVISHYLQRMVQQLPNLNINQSASQLAQHLTKVRGFKLQVSDNTSNTIRVKPGHIYLDMGGDDIYLCAQDSRFEKPIIIIDIDGNDIYQCAQGSAWAAGIGTLQLLFDFNGNDQYVASRWSIASAFLGIGLLYDMAGDDRYIAQDFSQATAWQGLAWLIDETGNDQYHINAFGQSLALYEGKTLLWDKAGNDSYFGKGSEPSSYNEPSLYDGLVQGVGFGLRPFYAGGQALLRDDQGVDRYEGGNFSQGGGYYFGVGLLLDLGTENDQYWGTRYSAGFAAHQAVGGFLDKGGNDYYRTLNSAIAGIAWDESIASFYDKEGNNHFLTQEFSLGAADQNSIALFYLGEHPKNSISSSLLNQKNDYYQSSSLSIRINAKSADAYNREAHQLRQHYELNFALPAPFPSHLNTQIQTIID